MFLWKHVSHVPNYKRSELKLPQRNLFYRTENYVLVNQIPDLLLSRIFCRNLALNSRFPLQITWTQTCATRHALETSEGAHNPKRSVTGAFLAFSNIYTCLVSACWTCWVGHKYHSVVRLTDFLTHIAPIILLWCLGVGCAVYSYCISHFRIHATSPANPSYFILLPSNI